MSKLKIFITRSIPKSGIDLLKKSGAQVLVGKSDAPPSKAEILRGIKNCDAMISLLTDRIDSEILSASPRLKIVANYAVGFNNIDVKSASAKKIWVTNTPGVLTLASAEMAWTLLFACARRLTESERFTRNKKFKGWAAQDFLGQDISGKVLGIVGAGRIGSAMAQMSRGFNMKILYTSRKRKQDLDEIGGKKVPIETLLKQSDFVSLHVAYNADTHHLITHKELALMKPNAILINTARGAIVKEEDLVRALKSKTIFAAGLDVYEQEPQINAGLFKLNNVILAPHIASATKTTRDQMALMAAQNVLSALNNKRPPNAINDL